MLYKNQGLALRLKGHAEKNGLLFTHTRRPQHIQEFVCHSVIWECPRAGTWLRALRVSAPRARRWGCPLGGPFPKPSGKWSAARRKAPWGLPSAECLDGCGSGATLAAESPAKGSTTRASSHQLPHQDFTMRRTRNQGMSAHMAPRHPCGRDSAAHPAFPWLGYGCLHHGLCSVLAS